MLVIRFIILITFIFNSLGVIPVSAQELVLPKPGVMIHLSPPMNPPVLKGIKVHTDNPFRFDFVLDKGDSTISNAELKDESSKLIKYFLASLTIPEKDLWVNLSPYEKDRIVPESFGVTEMGRDLLAEDYMLKQITASLIYPEGETGKKFWKRIYEEAQKKYGNTNIPVNTFNKVWIVPEKAVVYENAKAGTAYVVESRLKVLLEVDYLSLEKHNVGAIHESPVPNKDINQIGSQIVREIVIPELTKEVNEGKNFAQLRQVYNSLILATWYKKKIKDSILSKVYADKSKTQGVNIDDPQEKEKIYQQYLKAFKKGVYNYIKDEPDPVTNQTTPRKYFSGGFTALGAAAMLSFAQASKVNNVPNQVLISANCAMSETETNGEIVKPVKTAEDVKYFLDEATDTEPINLAKLRMGENLRALVDPTLGITIFPEHLSTMIVLGFIKRVHDSTAPISLDNVYVPQWVKKAVLEWLEAKKISRIHNSTKVLEPAQVNEKKSVPIERTKPIPVDVKISVAENITHGPSFFYDPLSNTVVYVKAYEVKDHQFLIVLYKRGQFFEVVFDQKDLEKSDMKMFLQTHLVNNQENQSELINISSSDDLVGFFMKLVNPAMSPYVTLMADAKAKLEELDKKILQFKERVALQLNLKAAVSTVFYNIGGVLEEIDKGNASGALTIYNSQIHDAQYPSAEIELTNEEKEILKQELVTLLNEYKPLIFISTSPAMAKESNAPTANRVMKEKQGLSQPFYVLNSRQSSTMISVLEAYTLVFFVVPVSRYLQYWMINRSFENSVRILKNTKSDQMQVKNALKGVLEGLNLMSDDEIKKIKERLPIILAQRVKDPDDDIRQLTNQILEHLETSIISFTELGVFNYLEEHRGVKYLKAMSDSEIKFHIDHSGEFLTRIILPSHYGNLTLYLGSYYGNEHSRDIKHQLVIYGKGKLTTGEDYLEGPQVINAPQKGRFELYLGASPIIKKGATSLTIFERFDTVSRDQLKITLTPDFLMITNRSKNVKPLVKKAEYDEISFQTVRLLSDTLKKESHSRGNAAMKTDAVKDQIPLVQTWAEAIELLKTAPRINLHTIKSEGIVFRGVTGERAFNDVIQSSLIRTDKLGSGGNWGDLELASSWATGGARENIPGVLFAMPQSTLETYYRGSSNPGPVDIIRATHAYLMVQDHSGEYRPLADNYRILEIRLQGMSPAMANEAAEEVDIWTDGRIYTTFGRITLGLEYSNRGRVKLVPILDSDFLDVIVKDTGEKLGKIKRSERRFIPYAVQERILDNGRMEWNGKRHNLRSIHGTKSIKGNETVSLIYTEDGDHLLVKLGERELGILSEDGNDYVPKFMDIEERKLEAGRLSWEGERIPLKKLNGDMIITNDEAKVKLAPSEDMKYRMVQLNGRTIGSIDLKTNAYTPLIVGFKVQTLDQAGRLSWRGDRFPLGSDYKHEDVSFIASSDMKWLQVVISSIGVAVGRIELATDTYYPYARKKKVDGSSAMTNHALEAYHFEKFDTQNGDQVDVILEPTHEPLSNNEVIYKIGIRSDVFTKESTSTDYYANVRIHFQDGKPVGYDPPTFTRAGRGIDWLATFLKDKLDNLVKASDDVIRSDRMWNNPLDGFSDEERRVLSQDVTQGIQQLTASVKADQWLIRSGMGFDDEFIWWLKRSRLDNHKEKAHTGMDYAVFKAEDGTIKAILEGTEIPVMLTGKVRWVFDDLMQKTIVLETKVNKWKSILTFYTHVDPDIDSNLKPGERIKVGDTLEKGFIIAKVMPSKNTRSLAAKHFHLGMAVVSSGVIEQIRNLKIDFNILNEWDQRDRVIAYFNPLDLLPIETRTRMFVEGKKADVGIDTILIQPSQTITQENIDELRLKLRHSFPGLLEVRVLKENEELGELKEKMLQLKLDEGGLWKIEGLHFEKENVETDSIVNAIADVINTPASMAMKIKETSGIDLTSKEFVETQNTGEGIKFHMDPAMLQQLQNAPGFYPVIINIQPMLDLRKFLGISEVK